MQQVNDCFIKVKKECLKFISSQETKRDRFKNKDKMIKSFLIPVSFWISKRTSKKKPLVILAGCVAQAENSEIQKREPYIDIVIGPQSYHRLNEKILEQAKKNKKIEETEFDSFEKFN